MDNKGLPLVSVPVITYNSSATIIETLDSIYNQTYPNIELIVSDDCSPDNTVELVRDWLETHKDRFARVELLTVEKNTGVSGNCNRSGAACTGVWSKGIAGDDIMLPNCIQDCMDYVTEHPDTIYLWGRCEAFGKDAKRVKRMNEFFIYDFFSWPREKQIDFLTLERNCIPAVSVFLNIKKAKEVGVKNDERIPNLEDWPKWINLLRAGVTFHFIDKVIVLYRMSENALSTGTSSSATFMRSSALMYIYYQFGPQFRKGNKLLALRRYVRAKRSLNPNIGWKIANKTLKFITPRSMEEQI